MAKELLNDLGSPPLATSVEIHSLPFEFQQFADCRVLPQSCCGNMIPLASSVRTLFFRRARSSTFCLGGKDGTLNRTYHVLMTGVLLNIDILTLEEYFSCGSIHVLMLTKAWLLLASRPLGIWGCPAPPRF
jgi:hypothetical protein